MNKAKNAGGGIYFTCTLRSTICNLQLGLQVKNNFAYQGGGIYWD